MGLFSYVPISPFCVESQALAPHSTHSSVSPFYLGRIAIERLRFCRTLVTIFLRHRRQQDRNYLCLRLRLPLPPLLYLRVAYLYCTRVYKSPSHGLVNGRQSSPLYSSFRLRAFVFARLLDGKSNYRAEVNCVSVAIEKVGVDLVERGEIAGNGSEDKKGFK